MVDRRPSLDRHLSILLCYPSSLSKPRPLEAVVEKEYKLLRRSESWDDRAPSMFRAAAEALQIEGYPFELLHDSRCLTRQQLREFLELLTRRYEAESTSAGS